MKTYLLFLLSFLASAAFSQTSNDKKVFLDSLWKETSEGNHKYYRIIKDYNSDQNTYKVFDYYASGVLQMEGEYLDKFAYKKEGEFTFYYENGNKKSVINYQKSLPIGKYISWYENGNKQLEGEYLKNIKDPQFAGEIKIDQYWDSNGVQKIIDGNGYYEERILDSYKMGEIKNGLKNKTWTGYDKYIPCSYTEEYKDGKFISGKSIDSKKREHTYTEVEVQPQPKYGIDHFYKYIAQNYKVPNKINYAIKGKIFLGFYINTNGNAEDIEILKGLEKSLDESAIKIIKKYENWAPGIYRGIKVRVHYSIPLAIDLKVE